MTLDELVAVNINIPYTFTPDLLSKSWLIHRWCKDNQITYAYDMSVHKFYFQYEEDAIRFKLRWM